MKLQVIRTQFGKDAASGLVFIIGIFECYTLEDQYQAVKVMHETCIPEGTYDIKLRTTGGFHARYAAKYGIMHHGMLHIQDVPGFEYILIHTGNTDENTSGCLILGNTQQDLDVSQDGFVGSSVAAYKRFYPKVAGELLKGNDVTIEYSKINLDTPSADSTTPDTNEIIMEKLSEIKGFMIKLDANIKGKNIT